MDRSGRVLQVNVSRGGVPKTPVERAWVSRLGLEGDGHHERTVHGGPHRAVCLFGIEAIERLQAEGHPVEPGSVGENLTTVGVEWSLLPVGTRARIGDALELELASSTTPCATQQRNFRDGRFSRISIDLHPSDSRMYARVVREGEVRPGDPVTVLDPPPESRARDELLLGRLDQAETASSLAAWKAAAAAGFDVSIADDGELAMVAAPQLPGPAFNQASGLARMPQLVPVATEFFDTRGCPGWLVTEEAPWPGAELTREFDVLAAQPGEVAEQAAADGIEIRRAGPGDAAVVVSIFAASGMTGADDPRGAWLPVQAAFIESPRRHLMIAEQSGRPVATAALHVRHHTGWLRGAAVVPEARGQGIQRALIAARVRLARELGCDLVGSWAEHASASAANLERLGLRAIGKRRQYAYRPARVSDE
jgi:MOSC domain-containing protein YiiM/GNAT superfamily N-acetyltransferase